MSSFKIPPLSFSSFKFKILLSFSSSIPSAKPSKTLSFPSLLKNPKKTLIPIPIPPKSMASSSSWTCSKCTFINQNPQNPKCQICSSSRSPPPISSPSNQERWACKACTFLNPYKLSNCEICGTRNSSFSSNLRLEDDELEMGSSSIVGDVFLPLLQRCSNNGKRKMEDGDGDGDGVDLGVSRGLKSVDRKMVHSVAADRFIDLGGSRDVKSVHKASVASDETQPKADLTTLKILSYNVWFAEDIELRIRMRAIGDIIQLHSPNVICLQEVTPDIYAILQSSGWWKSYKCSVSFDKAITRGYFCMQLSKLPVKSYSCEQFSYSAMGRELCIAEVVGPGDTPLVVATSHLESPCPGPPKWDQMYSKERVQQAKEAIEFLGKHPNAIFCGDMNWDDKLDGEFPMPDGWIDAWTAMRPKETGWTYDTKANAMLSANRKLQKRLDRFLVGLRDFRVEQVEMVGTKPIPEVTYLKQKKGGKELELPVLPSDHFGLLLTVTRR